MTWNSGTIIAYYTVVCLPLLTVWRDR